MHRLPQILNWFKGNSKLSRIDDLQFLHDYILKETKTEMREISYSNDYKFNYFPIQLEHIRPENMFKLNWMLICDNLSLYFPNINIECNFEAPSLIDSQIQNKKGSFKHDVYISINEKYDCAIEFFESKSHQKASIDSNKDAYSQQVVDYYIIHKEKQDFDIFFHDTIHKILLLICASTDDLYTLSKINFFKNNKNNPKKIKKQTEYFNKIINYHKENKFNFEDFFKQLKPKNLETEDDYDLDEFIILLDEEYDLIIAMDKYGNCDYQTFASIILHLDGNISDILKTYKKIYLESMKIMLESQNEIIKHINLSNKKKLYLPAFLNSFLNNQIKNYIDKFTLDSVFTKLKDRFLK